MRVIAQSVFSDDYRAFVQLLIKHRKAQRLTQDQVAAALGVQRSLVGKVERCERRIDVIELRNWCRALGISMQSIIGELEALLSPE